MNCRNIWILIVVVLFIPPAVYGGFFQGDAKPGLSDVRQNESGQNIVPDPIDKLIIKRKEEAQKLITEGRELIIKGKRKNNQDLVTKGQIKKEIGEKQLKLLKEQAENRKNSDERSGW